MNRIDYCPFCGSDDTEFIDDHEAVSTSYYCFVCKKVSDYDDMRHEYE